VRKIDLKTLIKYTDKWIGLSPDRSKIITSGNSLLEVNKKLEKLSIKDAIVTYVIPADHYAAPLCQY